MKSVKQTGFTLIELVVVIALLGILAAFALPRFASLESEARSAATQGLSGSVRSAAAMAHGLFLATGTSPVQMEGTPIVITNGYPDATDIAATLADSAGFTVTVNAGNDTATFAKTGTAGPCEVVYVEAVAPNPPQISIDPTGC